MRVQILKHNCVTGSYANMIQAFVNLPPVDKCPFYFKLFNAHCFNFLGIRIIIGEYR